MVQIGNMADLVPGGSRFLGPISLKDLNYVPLLAKSGTDFTKGLKLSPFIG